MNTNNSNPTKKRKVDDGRADNVSGNNGNKQDEQNNDASSQLDRMEKMMMRVEDKLGTISSLESRCEELERKCSCLESTLELTLQSVTDVGRKLDSLQNNSDKKRSVLEARLESSMMQTLKDHVDKKFDSMLNNLDEKSSSQKDFVDDKIEALRLETQTYHEYNSMLVKNQAWEYSADILPIDQIMSEADCDYHTAVNLTKEMQRIKERTIKMRRGEFIIEGNKWKNISLDTYHVHDHDFSRVLRAHWEEFAAALKQFAPAMNLLPDECDTSFRFSIVMLNRSEQMMMKKALIGKPFTSMHFNYNPFVDGEYGGMTVNDIIAIAESNKHLQRLQISKSHIRGDITERLCSVVRNHPVLELKMQDTIYDPGVGNAIVANLFTNVELKLEFLFMRSAGITSDVITVLADFLAANSSLKYLDLENNSLKDSDAALIANALRSNTTLYTLSLSHNNISTDGFEFFRPVLCNESSLNAVADSNHSCYISEFSYEVNHLNEIEMNRGWKIYSLLSSRHTAESNVQYFSDVDVKLLPKMLEAVQRYANNPNARRLSIVYEIMRRWEKVFNMYEG